MYFKRIQPETELQRIIECYWIAEAPTAQPQPIKIIPDGFTEVIFHFGDPYRIRIHDEWEIQSKRLLAGQISRHFYLENTGASDIIGIKMKPTALAQLFSIAMTGLTDTVRDLAIVLGNAVSPLINRLHETNGRDERIAELNNYFRKLFLEKPRPVTPAERAAELIRTDHGMSSIAAVSDSVGVGERQLENLFKRDVGLSPKLFARIIRFNYIFDLVQQNKQTWCDLAYEAAFYDQSHFIRNFRDFTGENPADYAFEEKNMANFFLNKTSI